MGSRALMIANGGDTELSVEMTASPIKGPDGSLGGVVVVTMLAAHAFDPRLIWDQLGEADG